MDQPLFGETNKQTQLIQYAIGGAIAAFTVFSLIVGILFGLKNNSRDFTLVFVLAFIFICTGVLMWWWRDRDDAIHPKFKWLLILLLLTTLLAGIAVNVYAWEKPPLPQPECEGLYITDRRMCIPWFNGTACETGCYNIDFGIPLITCMNCTVCPPGNNTAEVEITDYAPDIYSFPLPGSGEKPKIKSADPY
ncbi:hypothetical protein SAMD00019534_079930 [Acytostelium subglobosum LB1]|uniref:hypothetical protein n=1 Tax=Acytostelium subglobosum LB1 TaxID=1410327 RepID=UPI0006450DDE|nr:hypothetical protein SAMD00019534_079930 [Acytostelium subglobosum LB1]GAM24818.1 hypothetical protein SAMD00019534_079930 [Acytostelium subglobosum LB1]|eukprot:XP_012752487.1 hypothetical protein SAMD00019534_079930 [Acytostelium subglobosum LB1]